MTLLFSIVKKLIPFLALLCIPAAHAQGRFNPNQLPTNTVLHSSNATPLFNTSINNQTQTFTILGVNANTVFGNCTNSFGLPSFCSLTAAMEPSTTVNAVTNDTNVTGTITAQNFAIAWAGVLAVSRGGTGVGTISGLIKGNGTSPFSAATSADVIALWSGTCNSSTFLRGDGSCQAAGGGGGSSAFNAITTGTNTGATMVVGSGASLGVTGSGTIDATTLGAHTFANPGPIGSGTASTGAFTTLTGALTGNVTGNVSGTAASFTGNLTGDTTSVGMATTTVKVHGTSVPTNSAADQVLGTTASATGSWLSVPNCLDSAGNHINYNTSTHTFICGTSSGGATSTPFNVITAGTNTQASMLIGTGGSLGVTGSGTITATSAPFSGLTGSTNTTAAMLIGTGASLDVTGSGSINATKITSTTVPSNSAADQVLGTTASATGSWIAVPGCLDSGGNHLNYNTATHAFSCGTSGGTAGSAAFNTITSGTNASAAMVVGTGSSLAASGSGTITATTAPFSGLTSGTNTSAANIYGSGSSLNFSGTGTVNASSINGTTVPTNSAADQFLGTTASATGAWASVPSCTDSGGNHLNYNTATHAFSCGTSGGTAGSAAFNTITSGTNASAAMLVGTGSSLGVSGSGTIAATSAPYSGLTSGTNTTAAEIVGSGASLTFSGTGTINSSSVNGTTVPTNSAADQTIVTTASATGAWKALPSCLDSAGNHLNYNISTHAFACGTSTGSVSPAFSSITGATNTTAAMLIGSGASLDVTGTGTIDATSINSTSVPVNSAADQILGTTASATGAWASVPNCQDSAGNHLNYNTTTHAFSCGTSASGAGTTSFSSLTGSTNTSAAMVIGTGASLASTGSGTIDSTTLLSKTWASPAAIGTGTPTAITGTTITANTGFVGSLTGNVTGNVSGTAGSFTGNLTGDTTSVGMATTTGAVNGTTVPVNSAADQVLLTTSSATGAWKSVPNCTDSSGNHINYTASTHSFSCGTTANSCPTCVVASSPGLGVAHFAGGTQTATSSLVDLTADVTGLLPNANLAHASTTLNGQTCTLGSSCSLPIQTNSINNTSQNGINLLPSTVNATGLTVTPTNTATNQETFEITGNTIGSTSNYMTAYINTLIWGGSQLFVGGQSAVSCPVLVSPYIGGLCVLGPDSLPQIYNVNAAAWRDLATLDGGTFTAGHILAVGTNAPDVTDTGKALAGSGAGITTGPTSSTSGDFVSYTGTAGQTADSGIAATATGLNTAIKTLTGCNTATFVYTPQAADCVAPSGGGSGVSYGYISAAGASVGLTNPDIIAAYNYVKVTGARTITRISLFFATAPSGCSTYPVFGVYINGGGSGTTLTAANSQTTDDSGAISIAVSAGQTIQVGVITAEVGCSTKAAYPVETIEYQ